MSEVRILATCTLGLGFSRAGFEAGCALEPHAIACDAGSADFGPYFLGSGALQKSTRAVERDLEILLRGARDRDVPFLTGSVGGAGGRAQVAATADLTRDLARRTGMSFRMATIEADVTPDWLSKKMREGAVRAVNGASPLTEEAVRDACSAVAMMGEAPFLQALEEGADVVLAGRSTDPAIFVAPALRKGIPPDIAWHAAKSIDKGYLATTSPQGGSPVLARIYDDSFTIEPTREDSRCSVASVAALTLHENANPFEVLQPTGTICTRRAKYEQVDDRRVRVTGSRYHPADKPSLKIEGATLVGHRVILIAGIRDPRILSRMDDYLAAYRELIERVARSLSIVKTDYQLKFRVYGQNAVLGAFEQESGITGHECCLICDVVGKTEEIAGAIGSKLGPTGSRLDILGNMGGGGLFAYPFSPSLIKVGPVYEWSVWHVVECDLHELSTLFPVRIEQV